MTLTAQQIADAGLADWRKLARSLHARFLTRDFATGAAFVAAITEAAESANHHPDVRLSYTRVDLELISHDVGKLTSRDLKMARTISAIAAERGIASDPAGLAELQIALDTAAVGAAGEFWSVLLTGSRKALKGVDVVDRTGRLPLLWFQDTDEHPTPRQRFHLDLWLPPEVADERIEAAVAAGGTVVDTTQAPSFVVLADPEGNRVCVCTSLGRN